MNTQAIAFTENADGRTMVELYYSRKTPESREALLPEQLRFDQAQLSQKTGFLLQNY